MSVTHVQTKDAQTASGASLNVSLTSVGAGNHLFAHTVTATGPSSNNAPTSTPSATWSSGFAGIDSGGSSSSRGDYTENTASGSWTVTFNAGVTTEITGIASESSGAKTSASKGVSSTHGSAGASVGTIQPGSVTPTAGSILYTGVNDNGASTSADTIDSSFSVSSDATAWDGTHQRGGTAHLDNVAASATNPTWTLPASAASSVGIVEFLAAAGGAAAVALVTQRRVRGAGG